MSLGEEGNEACATYGRPTDKKDLYVEDLRSVGTAISQVGIEYRDSLNLELPSIPYYRLAIHMNDIMESLGHQLKMPDKTGLYISSQAILEMILAYKSAGRSNIPELLRAAKDPRTTGILKGMTRLGRLSSVPDHEDVDSRVSRVEVLLGLKSGENTPTFTQFAKLAMAFFYEDEGYFRISDAVSGPYERILAEEVAPERVCPMRARVEEVFCIVAQTACENRDLAPHDLRPDAIRPSGLIIP